MGKKTDWAANAFTAIVWTILLTCIAIIYVYIYKENKACVESGGVYVRSLVWFECVSR